MVTEILNVSSAIYWPVGTKVAEGKCKFSDVYGNNEQLVTDMEISVNVAFARALKAFLRKFGTIDRDNVLIRGAFTSTEAVIEIGESPYENELVAQSDTSTLVE